VAERLLDLKPADGFGVGVEMALPLMVFRFRRYADEKIAAP